MQLLNYKESLKRSYHIFISFFSTEVHFVFAHRNNNNSLVLYDHISPQSLNLIIKGPVLRLRLYDFNINLLFAYKMTYGLAQALTDFPTLHSYSPYLSCVSE